MRIFRFGRDRWGGRLELSNEVLRAYLNDELPLEESAAVEKLLREDTQARSMLNLVRQEMDSGEHSIGAIWRRRQLTCCSRDQLGAYLLGAMTPEQEQYIRFHLEVVGCQFCRANLDDLKEMQAEPVEQVRQRQQRILDSSIAYMSKLSSHHESAPAKKPGRKGQ